MQIILDNVQKYYKVGKDKLHVLKNLNLEIESGEFLMIMGKSGSGKTTLLNILGFLDTLDEGRYYFDGNDVSGLKENMRSQYRANYVGYVFQQFNLIETLTVFQNIEIPLIYAGMKDKNQRRMLVEKRLEDVGLSDKANSFPNHLSGGQQQRIAIARALVNNPKLIFADEPTGALDSETGRDIMGLLSDLNKSGTTIIMVTHDLDMTKYASRVVTLKDGCFVKGDEI
ncbi:MAG: ABC transporter ATP-binding protein [Peptostreptococcus porci]|uniref:ABC transporter ATP-binding protein n=1 Tax=Peptostreptococcus porci TaxID=2652282 RepID=A0A6N7XHF0_9FIRM|nr:ABC transporter ATP-binding protein [Peptostreptococcus porci]MDD7182984.1 ABC transporter ATP-binding protein [Peptostreptococcus porci]MDY5480402.1 ABC transporter ATP-binding protein [Peptostreptococcus porci]MDY6232213.1 ABC transporter ATP-binding protein [Peptostreptococcus porci]MST63043.1 ABC transporter ATP-binding protein [Peptostreptococcus porci]